MVVRKKVPSQAASGADTFSDSLVGRQVTDGTSQLTNTNFELDRVYPEKDSKNFRTGSFSDFLTLDNLKLETSGVSTTSNDKDDNKIKFKPSTDNGNKSIFGSLKSRISVSINRIITKFPAGILVDSESSVRTSQYTASNITYDVETNITEFNVETSILYNPFDVLFRTPLGNPDSNTDNPIRNFYSSYTKYIIIVSGISYDIISYVEPNTQNLFTLQIKGNAFNSSSTYSDSFLIKPNDGITEEFFNGLDDLESVILNRDINPIYTSTFRVPQDSFDMSSTNLIQVTATWPVSKDNWNIKIHGIDFITYAEKLSDIATEIDDYKSNLFIRFMASPQLFEFDSDDKKIEAVFQIYGQSFDRVKKYIDNIAFMRNVSYDGIQNLPDILLKNLSTTLGLETINLTDDRTVEDLLYKRHDKVYEGLSIGSSIIEAEYEFYRRMLVNLAHLYKSKGTRSSIEFFLRFLGAPDPMIQVNEYSYKITSYPKSFDLESDIYDVLAGTKTINYAELSPTAFTYNIISTTSSSTLTRSEYPVKEYSNTPRTFYSESNEIFFQKGSGWYDITLEHRSPDILDVENSILTGKTKTIKTTYKSYTYGEDYFDLYRTLPGLDTGYELVTLIDNLQGSISNNITSDIFNRKNISIYISSANAVDYDIYTKSRELLLTFGTASLTPQTGVTFAQYVDKILHEQITNSNTIRYKKNYIKLEDIYRDYITNTGFTPYYIGDINEFVNLMGTNWTSLLEQIIPATTLWTGGNIIENNRFGRPKYQYRLGCQPKEFVETLYPNFVDIINDNIKNVIGDGDIENINNFEVTPNYFRGLINLLSITIYPIIEIDGVIYSGNTYSMCLSGATLFNQFTVPSCGLATEQVWCCDLFGTASLTNTGCTLSGEAISSLPLICGYENYLNLDITALENNWVDILTGLTENINQSTTGYTGGYYYDDQSNTICTLSGIAIFSFDETASIEYKPKLTYEIFTDINGDKKIKFSSIKHGTNDCSIEEFFDYRFVVDISTTKNKCEISTTVSAINNDIFINVLGDSPVTVFKDCNPTPNPIGIEYNECEYVIRNASSFPIDLLFTNIDNCDLKVRIDDLNTQVYRQSFNYGLKNDSTVLVINGAPINDDTTGNEITTYIINGTILRKMVSELNIGDTLLLSGDFDCSSITSRELKNGLINNDISFLQNYTTKTISDIDCLGSVKKYRIFGKLASFYEDCSIVGFSEYDIDGVNCDINGSSQYYNEHFTINGFVNYVRDGIYQTFYVLPTTELFVYTNKNIDIKGNVFDNKTYFFDNRYPENLQVRTLKVENNDCCGEDLYGRGDFLITYDGKLIEVLSVDFEYCDAEMYYNINFYNDIDINYLSTFNGNNYEQIMLRHKYIKHINCSLSPTPTPTVCCPDGYVTLINPPKCQYTETIPATPPDILYYIVKVPDTLGHHPYTSKGTAIFNKGFNLDGTQGTAPTYNPPPLIETNWWKNIEPNETDGPMNRTMIWGCPLTNLTCFTSPGHLDEVGFSFIVNVPADKDVYIGVGADNYSKITINNETVLDQNWDTLATMWNGLHQNDVCFIYWYIYPITLKEGDNIIEISCVNEDLGGLAAFGCQVYDATASQLTGVTSQEQLNEFLLFSSDWEVTDPLTPVYFGSSGYTCPSGYTLVGNQCVKINTYDCGEAPPLFPTPTPTPIPDFIFDADYIMLTYEFTDGLDLDTRTRIVTPDVGQNTQSKYLGWSCQSQWPIASGTPYLTWGGDNLGTGFESILIDLINFSTDYPSATEIVMDLRAFWYRTMGSNPVNVAATLWKGGTPIKDGCLESTYFCWTNPTAIDTFNIDSVGKIITSEGLPDKGTSSGERVATLTYNLLNNVGSFNINDITTPSV